MVFCCQESFPQVVALAGTTSTSLGGAFDGRPLTTNVPRQWDRFLGDGAVSDCLASPFPSGCNSEDNPGQWWIAGCPLALHVAHRQRGRPDPDRRDTRGSPGRQVTWGDEEEAREEAEERGEAEGRLQDQGGDPQAADLRPPVQLDQVDQDISILMILMDDVKIDQDLHQDLLPRPQARALCQLPWIQGAQPGLPVEVHKHGKNTKILEKYNDKYDNAQETCFTYQRAFILIQWQIHKISKDS